MQLAKSNIEQPKDENEKEKPIMKTDDDVTEEEEEDHDDATDDEDELIKQHPSYEQVMLDVSRCAGRLQHLRRVYFHRTDEDEDHTNQPEDVANKSELSDSDIDQNTSQRSQLLIESQSKLKRKLAKLIVKLLIKNPNLHYYQGLHDVCLTYMTLLGDKLAIKKLNTLIDSHFKTFMQPTMIETQDFLDLIPVIIGLQDIEVQKFMESSEVGTIFALSWVITWFSHVVPNELDVERIFKFLEDKDSHMVLYLCAAIVLNKRDALLRLEPEMSTVHHYLCQVPRKERLPLSELLSKAVDSFVKFPPEMVRRKLDHQRKLRMQLTNFTLKSNLSNCIRPVLTNIIQSNAKTALLVFVIASAFALQYDRWAR